MITDVCVPLSALPAMIRATEDMTSRSPLPCPTVAHAGDGNIHVVILFRSGDPEEVKEAKRLASDMADMAIGFGGTCTGEHGVGVGKKDKLEKVFNRAHLLGIHFVNKLCRKWDQLR